ncbi:CARDB domain-containing protein [Modicisalibacter ilicicola]|uniref:CARDB domain-containing protein n=1 Tax=Modicisalibacter ilicicola TaxID=480814 RepID=UPI0009336E52|nr:CARDB domain-containing protein [Halomonas ilicicola]
MLLAAALLWGMAGMSVAAANEPLYFPPPLVVEPLVPPIAPEDELERDPGGVLVLPNVRANESPGACAEDSPTACAQNETTLDVNPTDHDNWVGGANDYSGPIVVNGRRQSSCGFYASNDAGQTWSGGLLPTQPGYVLGGDPSLAFDANGDLYYACLNVDLETSDSALYVFKSTDGGASFGAPTEVITGNGSFDFHDKEFLTTGDLTDKVYLAWMHQGDIRLAGSDDGGASFSAPAPADNVEISDPDTSRNQGVVLATWTFSDPDGSSETLYAAWRRAVGDSGGRILFDRSTDGGQSFGDDVVVEGNLVRFPIRTISTGGTSNDFPSLIGEHGDPEFNPDNAFRVNSFPSLDVCRNPMSPYYGHLYIVFADYRFGNGDIFFKRSEDGGETWPGAFTRRVNDDDSGHDQFSPWIDVDENCKINVSFYDRRDDPDNLRFHLYFSHSTDSGASFSPNARMTTAPSTNAQFLGGFIGDYLQVAATVAENATFHHQVDRAATLWMDTREGGQEVYAATLLQTGNGTWINVDVDLVADQPATDLDFIFPGDVSDAFGGIYHGDANPFQDHEISHDAGTDQTTLAFVDPQPGPLQPGDLAHVGFVLEADVPTIDTFWTGSGNIGDIPMTTVDFTYDPVGRVVTAFLCNDRLDGQAIAIGQPAYATLELPVELEALNGDDLPGELAAQGEALSDLPAAVGPITTGNCYSREIPEAVAQYEAVVLTTTLSFVGSNGRGRSELFAQKIAKDAREVEGTPREPFHYLAKLVCGTQSSTTDLRLARGHYATTINAFNLGDRPARLEKTLALAIPPGRQHPGKTWPLGRDSLPPGLALATECNDIRERIFDGNLPASVIDGYVTIISDQPLEVTGVYSTATLNAEGTAEDHSAIHVERAIERRLETRNGDKPLADLVIDETLSIDAICGPRRCRVSLRFTVRNIGAAAANAFSVDISRSDSGDSLDSVPVPGGLAPSAATTETLTVGYPFEPSAEREICLTADAPANEVDESEEGNNERCVTF